jgi:hypothetical protein
MREWRKLHKGIASSDKLRAVGSDAKWLYVLLIVAQDDRGNYPWTPAKIDALVRPTTGWDSDVTESLLNRLRSGGLIELTDEGFVQVTGGAEKNGTPLNSKKWPLHYDPPARIGSESVPNRLRNPRGREESERRVDKNSPPSPNGDVPPQTGESPEWLKRLYELDYAKTDQLNATQINRLETDFKGVLTPFEISKFVNHHGKKSHPKWDTYQRLLTWMGKCLRDVGKESLRDGTRPARDRGIPDDQSEYVQSIKRLNG